MALSLNFCMDHNPTHDFYNYVNGDWLKNNPIPDDHTRWSVFNELDEENKDKVKNLLDNLKERKDLNQEFESLKVLYNQGNNIDFINKNQPRSYIEKYLKQINESENKEKLLKVIFNLHYLHGISTPIALTSYSDLKDSNNIILHIFTSGLGLPDRDYYFLNDKEEIRNKYKQFILKYFNAFNIVITAEQMESIFNLEKILAEYTMTRVEKRDPDNLNNPTTYKNLVDKYKSIPLKMFFEYVENLDVNNSIENLDNLKINVGNPKFLDKHEELWNNISLDTWKLYYVWKFIGSISSYVNESISELKFDFYGKELSGAKELLPRWKRVISNCNSMLGVVIGKLFVEKYFTQSAKNKANNMISYIIKELRIRLSNNDWMQSETKEKAIQKLDKITVKVGYPDKPKNYNSLVLNEVNNYLENNLLCLKFEEDLSWKKLYKPKDKSEWFMNPHMVNAYYSPSNNEIVFPAGILQKPFFDETYDAPLNFGAIGAVIGHEITHGFDDMGRKFDSDGNLNDWWTKVDETKYKNKTKKIRDQFEGYVIEGKNVNGDLTLGENIADLGGVSISFHALKKYLMENPNENITLEGFTPEQRFFINYAKIWRCNTRREEIHNRILTDPHSPPIFRVNGVVTNLVEFYKAFNVDNSSPLWKPESERISIW